MFPWDSLISPWEHVLPFRSCNSGPGLSRLVFGLIRIRVGVNYRRPVDKRWRERKPHVPLQRKSNCRTDGRSSVAQWQEGL